LEKEGEDVSLMDRVVRDETWGRSGWYQCSSRWYIAKRKKLSCLVKGNGGLLFEVKFNMEEYGRL
jgi:hypothetical protein